MRLDGRAVDQHFSRWSAGRRQSVEDVRPDELRSPTRKSIVGRLSWAIDRRRLGPPTSRTQHIDDATDSTAVLNPRDTLRIRWQQRCKPPALPIAPPETIRHPQLPQFGSLNHINDES